MFLSEPYWGKTSKDHLIDVDHIGMIGLLLFSNGARRRMHGK
jgi:hypothetical protein